MRKHTKGPWKLDRAGVNVVDPSEKAEYVIAFCKGASMDELTSNARLIASASDLLEALEEVTKWYSGDSQCSEAWQRAHAAIARAKGEQP
jgi:hypothetical protein